MGYLGDYLRWRGDLTFDQAPFCDADSLALTMLSYLNPEEVTAPGQKLLREFGSVSWHSVMPVFTHRQKSRENCR